MGRRRNYNLRTSFFDRTDQCVGIESFVGNDGLGLDALDQLRGLGQIVRLARGEFPSGQIPQPFDKAVNLGAQSAARAADRLVAVFFGAPAEC